MQSMTSIENIDMFLYDTPYMCFYTHMYTHTQNAQYLSWQRLLIVKQTFHVQEHIGKHHSLMRSGQKQYMFAHVLNMYIQVFSNVFDQPFTTWWALCCKLPAWLVKLPRWLVNDPYRRQLQLIAACLHFIIHIRLQTRWWKSWSWFQNCNKSSAVRVEAQKACCILDFRVKCPSRRFQPNCSPPTIIFLAPTSKAAWKQ